MANPSDYQAQANILWSGTLAHNDICGAGRVQDWAGHGIEHELSALYDCAHGAGLAVIMLAWMTSVHGADDARFARFARNVFGVVLHIVLLYARAIALFHSASGYCNAGNYRHATRNPHERYALSQKHNGEQDADYRGPLGRNRLCENSLRTKYSRRAKDVMCPLREFNSDGVLREGRVEEEDAASISPFSVGAMTEGVRSWLFAYRMGWNPVFGTLRATCEKALVPGGGTRARLYTSAKLPRCSKR